jgi:hypothetical protein
VHEAAAAAKREKIMAKALISCFVISEDLRDGILEIQSRVMTMHRLRDQENATQLLTSANKCPQQKKESLLSPCCL